MAQTLFLALLAFAAFAGISEARTIHGGVLTSNGAAGAYAKRGVALVDQLQPRVDLVGTSAADPTDGPITNTRQFALSETTVTTAKPASTQAAASTDVASIDAASTDTASTDAASSTPTTTTTISSASASSASATPTDFVLPKPFDTSLGSNFTEASCPQFFQTFLNDPVFQKCLPFSLLLQNSNSLFEASTSMSSLTKTLDVSCAAILPTCPLLMDSLATRIRLPNTCGADYNLENPLVRQAYAGLVAYAPLLSASCLKADNGTYCYVEAVLSPTATPADEYIYYLPLGLALPGGSRPRCNTCTQRTMGVFATYAGNLTQPLSTDYSSAATLVDAGCGPNFVNTSVSVITGTAPSAGGMVRAGWGLPVLGAGLVVLVGLLGV